MSSDPLDDPYGAFNRRANERKLKLYWLGFMEGVVASGDIERREPEALEAEVCQLLQHVYDPDANDLLQDLRAGCWESEEDLMHLIDHFIGEQRSQIGWPPALSAKDSVNRFLGFCAGINCDGTILPGEAFELARRLKSISGVADNFLLQNIHSVLEAGGTSDELSKAISDATGECFADTGLPALGQTVRPANDNSYSGELLFNGKIFVLTGRTEIPRPQLSAMIRSAGGEIRDRVTRQTNYLVYGLESSPSWKTTSHGNKIEYAKTLISKGANIKLVPEHDLEASLKAGR